MTKKDYQKDPDKPKVHPLERAWAGGVLDAKGGMDKIRQNIIRFDSTDEQLIRRFYEAVGVGVVRSRTVKNGPAPSWYWETTSMDNCREVCLLLLPFLSARRTKEAANLVSRIERTPLWAKQNPEKAEALITQQKAVSFTNELAVKPRAGRRMQPRITTQDG